MGQSTSRQSRRSRRGNNVVIQQLSSPCESKSALRQFENCTTSTGKGTAVGDCIGISLGKDGQSLPFPSHSPPASPGLHAKKKRRRATSTPVKRHKDRIVATSPHRFLSVSSAVPLGTLTIDRRKSKRSGGEYDSVKPTIADVLEAVEEGVEEDNPNEVFGDLPPSPTRRHPQRLSDRSTADDRYISLIGEGGTLIKASTSVRVGRSANGAKAVADLALKYPSLAQSKAGTAMTT